MSDSIVDCICTEAAHTGRASVNEEKKRGEKNEEKHEKTES